MNMKQKRPLDEISKFLETFPKLIDRPKDVAQTEDIYLREFLKQIIFHNQELKKKLTK